MTKFGIYDMISVAYRSRLLFRTDAEYRQAWGASFETVSNKRDSERDMQVYYSILSAGASLLIDKPLFNVIEDYVIASDVYLSLDWGDRSQMASRKKFCRMLFRLAATAGKPLSSEEVFRFKSKNVDTDLLKVFFPDGMDDAPIVIISFIVLFAFDIIRPWNGDGTRAHDVRNNETVGLLKKLRELILLLREDMPRLGSTEKPLVFSELDEIIENYINEPERLTECSPLMMLTALLDIARACHSLVDLEQLRIEGERCYGLRMDGIWIDDADRGENRFWIFPDNCLAAMCYKRNGVGWELDTYEFRMKQSFHPEYMDSFILVSPRDSLNYMLSPDRGLADEQMGSGCYDNERDEATGEFTKLTLYEEPRRFPEWLNWHSWERLAADDSRYEVMRSVLTAIYDPQNPHSVLFRNTAPEIFDNVNNLVGHDNKYVYFFDWQPKRFIVREKRPEVFTYEGDSKSYATQKALFELNISDAHPLYAIPVTLKRKPHGNSELEKLAEIMDDADNISEAHIIHSAGSEHPRLVFPIYGRSITLDMSVLSAYGVVKFTSRPF